jgi:hypothetical protein
VLVLGNPTTTEPLPALHYAEQEAKRIAQMYSTPPLVGAAATESAVFSQAEMAGILHLAAHGKYNPDNPLFSTLYLAPDKQRDGRLEVHDIYGLDLTKVTNLVVLSACQTQMGQLSKGDEVVGLNRAFLYAGTPSVMASLWSVDDKVTGLLMEGFYTHLQAGMTKAEALRQAQIDIRTEYPHPYYWAAFVLTGDGGSVAVSGGLAGVKQRLASSSDKVRIAALSEALEYVTEGSLLVAQIVKTETGAVQCAAYDLLYRETDEEGKQELLKYFPLRSEVGADYTKLRDLLAAKKWKEADQETRRLMLWVAHGEQKGRLTSIDIEQFPCADLLTIDHLWVRESGNRFGFSVQKRIYFEKRRNYDENLGWIIRAGKSRLVRYSSGIFNLDAPVGHLPYQCSWSSESSVGGNLVPSLAQKLETCSIP